MMPSESTLPGLTAFAQRIFERVTRSFDLDDFVIADTEPTYATGRLVSQTGPTLRAGTSVELLATTEIDRLDPKVWPRPMTEAETNLWQRTSKFAILATSVHFEMFRLRPDGTRLLLSDEAAFHLSSVICWSWNVGGNAAPTHYFGPLATWLTPTDPGLPLFAPPRMCTVLNIFSCHDVSLWQYGFEDGDEVGIKAVLHGCTLAHGV